MAAPRYVADPVEDIRTVALDGLCVLYHARSGATHIVAPPVPEILEALREGPAGAAELLRRLERQFEIEGDGIAARLEELEAAGLVRRA
ncbi:HPr-rel-A system PqqD family peptide chaperone [Sphingosinicella sp. LHD-64]|uniref:HPr-rel-A system PqqD family peptide chaperone n=1 Tax=Sphingosinicella sp. LHD-64 TaxID=3072139 RepID=UPI00280D4B40|nr:HPr-rel-A system PqqD family peptide chaperone [Sphingosinicella sp. LHD-64]MDQ8757780.1 HPr-rel-A system PqqD family peptide chaperone [Sphingosinicella sp. LHD-64]